MRKMANFPERAWAETNLIGKSEQEARTLAEANAYDFRISQKDGENYMLTADYKQNRINAIIEDGKVTKIDFIG